MSFASLELIYGKWPILLIMFIMLFDKLAFIDCGGQTSKSGSRPIGAFLDNLSLVDVEPELLSMVGDANFEQIPVIKESKLAQVEKMRAIIFAYGDNYKLLGNKMDRKTLEFNVAQMVKLLNESMPLSGNDLALKNELEPIYALSQSVKASNCNENEGLFFDKLEAMALKYKPFPNVHDYINHVFQAQLHYCQTLFDSLLADAKKLLDRKSITEANIFAKLYEKARYDITSVSDDDDNDNLHRQQRPLKLRSLVRNVEYRRLIEASSLYLLQQLDSEELAKSRIAYECSRVVQSQLYTLNHACSVIRDAFSGLARVHDRLAGLMKSDIEMGQFGASPPRSLANGHAIESTSQSWLQLADACNAAKGVFQMSEPIERAYKIKVLIEKFPKALLANPDANERDAIVKLHWKDLKLKLFGSDERNKMLPRATLQTLRDFQRIGIDTNLGANIYFRDITDEVELVDMSIINEARCLSGFFDRFENIYVRFAQFKVNIEPYLAYYYRQQIVLCNERFAKLLDMSARSNQLESSLNETSLTILDSFTKFFIENTKQSLAQWIDQEYLRDTQAFYRLLGIYLKKISPQSITQSSEFQSQVIPHENASSRGNFDRLKLACRDFNYGQPVVNQLIELYNRIHDLTNRPVFIGDEHSIGVEWLFKARICNHIEFTNFNNTLVRYI